MLKIAFSDIYKYQLPEGHRFPMEKYELIPQQLLHEGIVTQEHFFEPSVLEEKWILSIHDQVYWEQLKHQTLPAKAARKIGLPMSAHLVQRGRIISQGTVDCALHALQYGAAMNIAGGTHHSYRDRGEGFCVINDFAITSQYLLSNKLAKKILIVDLDVHQGNGTAAIFQQENRVFTFSMHGAKNYPLKKEKSDLDIPLEDQTDDATYLSILKDQLPTLIEKVKPDFICYLSGVDVLATDKLGRLGMTLGGCRERDLIVFEQCHKYGIPVAVSMGGGYSERLSHIVDAHTNTYRMAQEVFF
jgi:acetoin utilization deacetylase AcuC-like enzyme